MSIRLRVALVAALSVVIAANAAATLYAAATAPVIKACVAKSGVMRYVPSGKCAAGEKTLVWNVQGPTGPAGPAGSSGDVGAVSPPVLHSSGWKKTSIRTGTGGIWFPVGSVSLPAGTYDARVSGSVVSASGKWDAPASGACKFGSITLGYAFYGRGDERGIVAEDIVTLPTRGTLEVTCMIGEGGSTQVLVVATPVTLE